MDNHHDVEDNPWDDQREASRRLFQDIRLQYLEYNDTMVEDVIELLESIIQCLVTDDDIMGCMRHLLVVLKTDHDQRMVRRRRRGRPELLIERRYLFENGFKIRDIAVIYECSRRTIEKRLKEYNVSRFTVLSDMELDNLVKSVVELFPNCGEKTISGRLKATGVFIQRERVRDAMRRVDPEDYFTPSKI